MTQEYVNMYANTLITISSSEDENDVPKIIIRKTPKLTDLPTLLSKDATNQEPKTPPKNPSHGMPAEGIVNAALKKLGINEKINLSSNNSPSKKWHQTKRNASNQTNTQSKNQRVTHPLPRYEYLTNFLRSDRPFTIALEGNIAIGKSTFL